MPAYYYLTAFPNPQDVSLGRPQPDVAAAAIPNRPKDFPTLVHIPFAEEARVHIFGELFAEWSYALQQPVLIRANDDGSVDAWLHPEGFEPAAGAAPAKAPPA